MIPRYTTAEMATLWSDEHRLTVWWRVELAATRAWETRGVVPRGTSADLEAGFAALDKAALAARALEIEQTTQHDVIAFVQACEEALGDRARHLHFGMTSSDVVDTAFSLLLQEAGRLLVEELDFLLEAMVKRAVEHKHTPCLGRTHGQAAEPTTFGLKLLSFVAELQRGKLRLDNAVREVSTGKLSGAVGNYGNIPMEIEADALAALELHVEPVSTQVVPRDRHAMFFSTLAVLGGLIERFAVEVRHLMRSEVHEASEPFGKGQRGSSAMPHKKNPILSENLTGMARLLRSHACAALENQALWHERDISHSSVERVIAPDATTLLHFALRRMRGLVNGLVVDAGAMARHLEAAGDRSYSGAVLLALVESGVARHEAYGWVQRAALASGSFRDALARDEDVKRHLDDADLDLLFRLEHQLRHVDAMFDRVLGTQVR